MPLEFSTNTPANFNLETAVCGHGWYDLAPFSWDAEVSRLAYVLRSENGKAVSKATISTGANSLLVRLHRSTVGREKAERDIRHILRLDDEMSEFYEVANSKPGTQWVKARGAGRLLRSATVYEDLVKTLSTTNCSWGLTRNMVQNLVTKLGEPAGPGSNAFPTAHSMASVDESFYREEIKAGYRSPFFVELAQKVSSGELDPEAFLQSDLPTSELKAEIKKIKGFGDYAADNLLKLLGRNDGMALDSWLRARFYAKYNKNKTCPDKKITKHYAEYGKWKGLMIWCDMTEDWFESNVNNS
ncbi:MAG: Fe-S cluster assembly protein HesB [bacterium]|nr:Fe-S cluster assembly protein HesB [bacterium]